MNPVSRTIAEAAWRRRFAGLAFIVSASATTPAFAQPKNQQHTNSVSVSDGVSLSTASQPSDCTKLHSLSLSTAELNRQCVAIAGANAAYRDGVLTIRMDNGARKIFRTERSTMDAGAFGYALMGYYANLHLFVVSDVGIDSGNYTAIDGRTGKSTDFGSSFPHFSPNGQWIIVDDSVDGDPSMFRVLQIKDSVRAVAWSSKTDSTTLSAANFRFIRWKDDREAIFRLGRARSTILLVREEDGHWHYDIADDAEEQSPQ